MSVEIKCEKEELSNDTNNNSSKEFTRAVEIKKSSKLKSKKPIYECGDCSSQFPNKETLVKHVKISHLQLGNQNKFFCNHCPRSFSRRCHLARHTYRLHPSQIFECDFCKAPFKCKDNLYRHLKAVHLIDDNYKCGICGKIFKELCYVKVHILAVHLKEKQEECTICKKVFSTKSDRDKHVKFVHEKLKQYKCLLCKRTFALTSTIKKHIRRHFKKPGVIPLDEKNLNELIVKMKCNREDDESDD